MVRREQARSAYSSLYCISLGVSLQLVGGGGGGWGGGHLCYFLGSTGNPKVRRLPTFREQFKVSCSGSEEWIDTTE